MSHQLLKENTEIPCPGGGRPIKTTYGDIIRKKTLKSFKGHEYKFKSSDQNKLRRAIDSLERLQKDFERKMEISQKEFTKAFQNIITNADIL